MVLICWCHPLRCHGDELKMVIEKLAKKGEIKANTSMKTIIAGSRTISDSAQLERAIETCGFRISEVVCGDARGVDLMGSHWANVNGIPIKHFPANWDLGKSAGFRRNEEMAKYADCLIALWDGQSRGTEHMIEYMRMLHKKVIVYTLPAKVMPHEMYAEITSL